MSTPIPTKRVSAFDLTERQWLRRLRGSSLSNLADMANQLCFRQGLNVIQKSWTYQFDRSDKATGAGHLQYDTNLFAGANIDYYVDIQHTHPGASEIGVILTYLAPNDLENDADPQGTFGAAGQSMVRVRLIDTSDTKVDPPVSSSETWASILSGSEMPQPRAIHSTINTFEAEDSSGNASYNFPSNQDMHGYSARVLRSIFYVDYGTASSTKARRMKYGSIAGSIKHLVVHIRADYAAILDATVFEIPRLAT
tara:strand:- start:2269 stop:3027 length:759 start_codon:yes stop_codon:yes gene_type:complete